MKLSSFLFTHNFTQTAADHSLFVKFVDNRITILLVYVDDIILTGNDQSSIDQITSQLDKNFKIENLGTLTYFLGFEIARNKHGINLSQRKYTLDILTETGMFNCSPVSTPLNFSVKMQAIGDPLDDPTTYRRLIGKLVYLTNTRPNITYVVSHLSQYVVAPTKDHLQAALRVIRYLKQTIGQGIFLPAHSDIHLRGYNDFDWANCVDTRRFVIGLIIYLGESPISWKSKKQATISTSSSESEYHALAQTSCEIQWLTHLLQAIHITYTSPATIYCDNASTIKIATNPVFHERTKHVEIDCHTTKKKIQQGLLKLLPVRTNQQLADILTKALPPGLFSKLNSKLGSHNIYCPLEGGLRIQQNSCNSLKSYCPATENS